MSTAEKLDKLQDRVREIEIVLAKSNGEVDLVRKDIAGIQDTLKSMRDDGKWWNRLIVSSIVGLGFSAIGIVLLTGLGLK